MEIEGKLAPPVLKVQIFMSGKGKRQDRVVYTPISVVINDFERSGGRGSRVIGRAMNIKEKDWICHQKFMDRQPYENQMYYDFMRKKTDYLL